MTLLEQIITIGICGIATVITRFLPFLFFSGKKETPKVIQYLGKVLPTTLFCVLVVYCLKSVDILGGSHGIPELIAISLTVIVHLIFKKSFISIITGTACYILLVNFVFLV